MENRSNDLDLETGYKVSWIEYSNHRYIVNFNSLGMLPSFQQG